MAGEIIRLGDPTSHGGRVIEGSPVDICYGKPISFIGHKVWCPQCKGTFPIIEGAGTTTFYGKGVALAGMKTACGAVLIATQLTDLVESGSGSQNSKPANTHPSAGTASGLAQARDEDSNPIVEECFYALVDQDGNAAEGYLYDLHCGDELRTKAASYADGTTIKIGGVSPTRVVTWLEKDGGLKS